MFSIILHIFWHFASNNRNNEILYIVSRMSKNDCLGAQKVLL